MPTPLEKMNALAAKLTVGDKFRFKGLDAKVQAFSDEHLFLEVPEIAVTPDEVEGGGDNFFVRDREMQRLKDRIRELEIDRERMLSDPRYFEEMHYRHNRNRQRERDLSRISRYDTDRYVYDLQRGDIPIDLKHGPTPLPPTYIDDLAFKRPTQKKG